MPEKSRTLTITGDRDAREIDVIIEGDGKLCPLEIKKTATPDKRITKTFSLIDKSPLVLGTSRRALYERPPLCLRQRKPHCPDLDDIEPKHKNVFVL